MKQFFVKLFLYLITLSVAAMHINHEKLSKNISCLIKKYPDSKITIDKIKKQIDIYGTLMKKDSNIYTIIHPIKIAINNIELDNNYDYDNEIMVSLNQNLNELQKHLRDWIKYRLDVNYCEKHILPQIQEGEQ